MSDETTLLPCPYCGGEASKRLFYGTRYGVYCDECDARVGGLFNTEAEAIAAWNTRAERTCHAESDLSEWVCSRCQCWIPLGLTPENIKHASEWKFCPHCGARVKAVSE